MTTMLHTPITALAQAEAWAAAAHELSSLPDFELYKNGLEEFLRESAGWFGIESSHFYSVNRWGYYESCDNANGGLDVSWAFYKAHRSVGGILLTADGDDIANAMLDAEAEYIRLCEENRALAEEAAEDEAAEE